MFQYLMGIAKMLRCKTGTKWARDHDNMYSGFTDTIEAAYAQGDISKEEYDKLRTTAFGDTKEVK